MGDEIGFEVNTEPGDDVSFNVDTSPGDTIGWEVDTDPGDDISFSVDTSPGDQVGWEVDTDPGDDISFNVSDVVSIGIPESFKHYKIAAVTLGGHRVVSSRVSDGKMVYATQTDLLTGAKALYLTLHSAAADDGIQCVSFGEVIEGSWNWVADQPIYLGTNGLLSQTPPVGNNLAIYVASAVTSTKILFNPRVSIALVSRRIMAGKKYLEWDIATGSLKEVRSVDTSAGAADATKIVALDAAGKLALNMMPTGISPPTAIITTSEILAAGDMVNIHNSTGEKARKADATVAGKEAHGYVLAGAASAAPATVYFSDIVTGLTGLTPGARLYLGTTPGAVTATSPSSAGNVSQQVGVAITATTMSFDPRVGIVIAA